MASTWFSRRLGMFVIGALLATAIAGRTCGAIEVWMPETGEVNLDDAQRETPEARFKHAAALIGAGEPMSGVAQLRQLIAEHPDAPWVEQAGYLVAFGLLTGGRYEEAFEEWEEFLGRYPESKQKYGVREMQLKAAALRASENLHDGMGLFDHLISGAPTREFAAQCQKEKADAVMDAGDYLLARDQYVAVLDYDPDSPWAPYCWYKVAECDLRLAEWIQRGMEHLELARRAFRDFMEVFPEHKLADEARENLKRVQSEQAARYKMIAEYYLSPGGRPTAALPYLRYIKAELAETEEAKWAAEKIEQFLADPSVPVRGRYRKLNLPAVRPIKGEEPAIAEGDSDEP